MSFCYVFVTWELREKGSVIVSDATNEAGLFLLALKTCLSFEWLNFALGFLSVLEKAANTVYFLSCMQIKLLLLNEMIISNK